MWGKKIIMYYRRITTAKVADDFGISLGSTCDNFSNVLSIKRMAAKLILKLLYFLQKQRRMEIAQQ